ncbi:hypothetical protein VTK56DRAFT_5150 [Thermocarpiscus australiensis]
MTRAKAAGRLKTVFLFTFQHVSARCGTLGKNAVLCCAVLCCAPPAMPCKGKVCDKTTTSANMGGRKIRNLGSKADMDISPAPCTSSLHSCSNRSDRLASFPSRVHVAIWYISGHKTARYPNSSANNNFSYKSSLPRPAMPHYHYSYRPPAAEER